jgi:hypothetical protein
MIKPTDSINNEILVDEILQEHEKQKEKEFVELIARIIVDITFRNVEEQKQNSLNIEDH